MNLCNIKVGKSTRLCNVCLGLRFRIEYDKKNVIVKVKFGVNGCGLRPRPVRTNNLNRKRYAGSWCC